MLTESTSSAGLGLPDSWQPPPALLVLNKVDAVPRPERPNLLPLADRLRELRQFEDFFFVSAKDGEPGWLVGWPAGWLAGCMAPAAWPDPPSYAQTAMSMSACLAQLLLLFWLRCCRAGAGGAAGILVGAGHARGVDTRCGHGHRPSRGGAGACSWLGWAAACACLCAAGESGLLCRATVWSVCSVARCPTSPAVAAAAAASPRTPPGARRQWRLCVSSSSCASTRSCPTQSNCAHSAARPCRTGRVSAVLLGGLAG
jgi:hypothetical protein